MDGEWENPEVAEWNIPDHTPGAEALLLHGELLAQLTAAIERLKPPFRELIEIQLKRELSNQHIATTAGISLPAAKSRLLRARGALRVVYVSHSAE